MDFAWGLLVGFVLGALASYAVWVGSNFLLKKANDALADSTRLCGEAQKILNRAEALHDRVDVKLAQIRMNGERYEKES